jgi:ribonuclease HI
MKSTKSEQRSSKKSSTKTTSERIIIFCDGACSGNQFSNNIGGWGAILRYKGNIKEIFGGEHNTSNQRMELTACIKALEQLKTHNIPIEIYSDSAYLINCINDGWYQRWILNNWKTAAKKNVENRDLWERLIELMRKFNIRFHKVEGHAGVELNERADQLAQQGMREVR